MREESCEEREGERQRKRERERPAVAIRMAAGYSKYHSTEKQVERERER